jgi:hypothetical protein
LRIRLLQNLSIPAHASTIDLAHPLTVFMARLAALLLLLRRIVRQILVLRARAEFPNKKYQRSYNVVSLAGRARTSSSSRSP